MLENEDDPKRQAQKWRQPKKGAQLKKWKQLEKDDKQKQAGAELGQAQVKLEVIVEVLTEVGVKVEVCHY